MQQNGALENLEIKLKNAREQNAEVFEQVEKTYNETYKDFIDSFFKTDVLGAKKSISAFYQLEAFNYATKNTDANKKGKQPLEKFSQQQTRFFLEKALNKGLKVLPLKIVQKTKLQKQILTLDGKKEEFSEIFVKNTDFLQDSNYPLIQDLASQRILNKSDILIIFSKFQDNKDIRLSLDTLTQSKREIVKKYFYELNGTNKEERISSFSSEFSSDIKGLEKYFKGPVIDGVVNFVGRNFFKMKPYKKKIESKKMRLRRTFRIALLKLLRIKYSGFNVEKLLKQIDSLNDFESMFRLLQKLIEIIPENSELLEKYSIQEQVDDVEENIIEGESNKEKILAGEELTVKACTLITDTDQKLDKKTLEKILHEDTDIIGGEINFRKENTSLAKPHSGILTPSQEQGAKKIIFTNGGNLLDGGETEEINAGILNSTKGIVEEGNEDDEELGEEELEKFYKELKTEYNELEKKKQHMFASGEFEMLDEINEEILVLMVKLEKVSLLIGEEE